MLTGEGSDELFGGYERYRFYLLNQQLDGRWYGLLPGPLRRLVRDQIDGVASAFGAACGASLATRSWDAARMLESLYLDNFYCAFSAADQQTLGANPAHGSPYANYLRYTGSRPDGPLEPACLYADQKTYLVELLMKQDQMSMACSIESRVPFLDHPFVEFAARVPDSLRSAAATRKYILKKAVEDLLPLEIIYRKKMGFPTPLRQWLSDPGPPSCSSLVDPEGFLAAQLIDLQAGRLIERHRAGLEDATDRIWRLLNLQIWGDVYFTHRAASGKDFRAVTPFPRSPESVSIPRCAPVPPIPVMLMARELGPGGSPTAVDGSRPPSRPFPFQPACLLFSRRAIARPSCAKPACPS